MISCCSRLRLSCQAGLEWSKVVNKPGSFLFNGPQRLLEGFESDGVMVQLLVEFPKVLHYHVSTFVLDADQWCVEHRIGSLDQAQHKPVLDLGFHNEPLVSSFVSGSEALAGGISLGSYSIGWFVESTEASCGSLSHWLDKLFWSPIGA